MHNNYKKHRDRKFSHMNPNTPAYDKRTLHTIRGSYNRYQSQGMCEVASYMEAMMAANV